jgi:putative peptide zinc metalloprotease protein
MPLHGPERTVLLLVAAVVVVGGLLVRPLRPLAVAAGSVTLVAALPWGWAGDALVPALVSGVLLAVFVTAAYRHGPVVAGLPPMLRAAVTVPVLLLTVVGALLLPVSAPVPPHAALATWLTAPDAPPGTLLVPAGLWGDLVHDGVPAHRLIREGTGSAASADWTVSAAVPDAASVTTVGEGSTALTVQMSDRARTEERVREQADQRVQDAAQTLQAAREAVDLQQTAQQAERRAFGSLLAGTPGFTGPPAVEAALRDGGVDMRALAVLGSLSREYAVAVADLPVGAGEDPGAPRHEVLITGLGYASTAQPRVAAVLDQWLASWTPPLAPDAVTPGPDGILLSWTPESQPPA